ncbi:hypothetical protein GCM10020358_24280 [Amorphoplanes nipponensis]
MDSLFPTKKIYSPHGHVHLGRPESSSVVQGVDQRQILHEGINEAGSTASFIAAGTSYATHDEPMIPLYIFYSMFGFQRTADELWAAADQMTRASCWRDRRADHAQRRGPAARGRALAVDRGDQPGRGGVRPGVRVRDRAHHGRRPAPDVRREAGERLLLPDGLQRAVLQPAEPAEVDVDGLLKGIYRYAAAPETTGPKAQVLASGRACSGR